MEINEKILSERLGIPVVKTVAIERKGILELKEAIKQALSREFHPVMKIKFSRAIEKQISEIESLIEKDYRMNRRAIAILLLLGDYDILELLKREKNFSKIKEKVSIARFSVLPYEVLREIHENAERLLDGVVVYRETKHGLLKKISDLSLNPYFSLPLAFASLAFVYFFAGFLGAQILVDVIETAFEENINAPLNKVLAIYVPNYWIRELIGGEYGIVTLGLRYAVAIILPIVTTFFIAFSLLEDSGMLPRISYLLDTLFKKIGLSGRAAIPLLLGTGCGTMAVVVTRILESRRERIIATLLLAVGIPCSAQLGVMIGIAPDIKALLIWIFIVSLVLIATGTAASKILPGESPIFFMELPPLRVPSVKNVIYKTLSRLEWYVKEVMPIFVMISVLIWIGRITMVFDLLIAALAVPAKAIGLPAEAGKILLYGFFRRDYGAAGLYDLAEAGVMSYNQIIVAMVTLTLFVPCVAQFSVMCKERGLKTSVMIFLLSILIAFTTGYITYNLLKVVG